MISRFDSAINHFAFIQLRGWCGPYIRVRHAFGGIGEGELDV